MKKTNGNPKPPERLELTAPMEILAEAAAAPASGAEGGGQPRMARFSMVAYTGGTMRIAGWRLPVVVDLAGLAIPSQSRSVRFSHDAGSGVGHTDSIAVREGRLMATGVVSRDTPAAREVVTAAKNGFPWQASIGAGIEQFETVREGQTVTVNGREFKGPVNVVRKATLGEISFVDLGADGSTSVSVAASAKEPNMSETEVQPEQTKVEAAAQTDGGGTPLADPVPAMRVKAAAETRRLEAVAKACGGKHPDIEAKAIEEGWDVTRTELEVLRAERPALPNVQTNDNPPPTAQILEAALCLSGGLQAVEKAYEPTILEAADRSFRSMGVQELLLHAAWAGGYTGRVFRTGELPAILRAAWSSINIGGILSNVANKFLLEGFMATEQTWQAIAATRPVKDFKTVTSYRMTGALEYQKVAPNGELKSGTLADESFTNKADTYGLVMSIPRTDIINDDLGALTTAPRKLGRGSGLKLNSVFWTEFMDNAAFFTAGHKNYKAGADTAMGIDALTALELLFLDQTDPDGKPLGVLPAILLVPNALNVQATVLMRATELRDTTASTKYATSNPHAGKFRIERSSYLGNTAFTGNSVKAWYLLANPADLPVIEVAFLNGQQTPTIEQANADFNVLGIEMRGYHDFGVSKQDYRAAAKAKGEA